MVAVKTNSFRYYATKVFGRCQWCNLELSIETSTVDHIKPKSAGGTNAWWNLALSCGKCNSQKSGDDWGQPRFGPRVWTKKSNRAFRKKKKKLSEQDNVCRVFPVNLWPTTLTFTLNIPLGNGE